MLLEKLICSISISDESRSYVLHFYYPKIVSCSRIHMTKLRKKTAKFVMILRSSSNLFSIMSLRGFHSLFHSVLESCKNVYNRPIILKTPISHLPRKKKHGLKNAFLDTARYLLCLANEYSAEGTNDAVCRYAYFSNTS